MFGDDDGENRYLDSLNITAVEDNLYSSQLRLRLHLKPNHFRSNGMAKVRCRSRISTHDLDDYGGGGNPPRRMMNNGRRGENELGYESTYQQVYDHSLSNHRHPIIFDEKEATLLGEFFPILQSLRLLMSISSFLAHKICLPVASEWEYTTDD